MYIKKLQFLKIAGWSARTKPLSHFFAILGAKCLKIAFWQEKRYTDFQALRKNLAKKMKKILEKLHVIRKIAVPLQRFKEQLIVLQV